MKEYAKYMGIGLQLAATLLSGIFLGYFLDRKYGSLPWGTLGGSALGLGIGFYQLVKQMENKNEN